MTLKRRIRKYRKKITYSDTFIKSVGFVAFLFFKVYLRTLRIRVEIHPEAKDCLKERSILGFWHGKQFLLVPYLGKLKMAVMIDLSWAGSIQSVVLQQFGFRIVRGSSRRKGMQAMLKMKSLLEEGGVGGFALDGPRGPILQSKPGAVFLSRKLNRPVIPSASASEKHWTLKQTWCLYEIPKPFSCCRVVFGPPVFFDSDNCDTGLLDDSMNRWQDRSEYTGGNDQPDRQLETLDL